MIQIKNEKTLTFGKWKKEVGELFWTEQSTRWYKEAAEYTQYHQAIYQEIAPYIEKTDSVGDIGCGLGYLSLEIALNGGIVTASDIADLPLQDLEKRIKQNNIQNLFILKSDWSELENTHKWDVVVSSFFKCKLEEIAELMALCRKRVILVVSNGSEDSFLPWKRSNHYKKKAEALKKGLTMGGIPFLYKNLAIQFGQPLYSKEDAGEFIKNYIPDCPQTEIDSHIHKYLKKIPADANGNEYFFSNNKEIGIFIIERSKFEEWLGR